MHTHIHALKIVLVCVACLTGEAGSHVMPVLCVSPSDVHEEVGLDHMVPSKGCHPVAPFPVDVQLLKAGSCSIIVVIEKILVLYVGIHFIVTRIDAEEETVLVRELMVDFEIEVIEIIACPCGRGTFLDPLLYHYIG